MRITIDSIHIGTARAELPDGTASGIYKNAVSGPCTLHREGLAGDRQADRRVHGGPDKALHLFPKEHYRALATAFPAARAALIPGSIGENLSSGGVLEADVCIGDVFALGDVRIQITLPRRPCWKIDARYGVRGLAATMAQQGLIGWYYRVLVAGVVAPGNDLVVIERDPTAPSVAEFHATLSALRPPLTALARYAALDALPAAWRKRIADRLAWLRRHG